MSAYRSSFCLCNLLFYNIMALHNITKGNKMNDTALTLREAAKQLRISNQTLWRLRVEGKIKAIPVSIRKVVIMQSELNRYFEEQK